MVRRIVVTRSYIVLEDDEHRFYIGAQYYDFLVKAIDTARAMPEGTTISLKLPGDVSRVKAELEDLPGEEEEEEELLAEESALL